MIPPEARCWFRKELEERKALKVVNIPADHNCLFHALAYHLPPLGHEVVRQMVCDELALDPGQRYSEAFAPGEDNLNEDASFNAYVTRMRQDSEWGGDPELNAAASKFNLKIHIHGQGPDTVIDHESTDGPAAVPTPHTPGPGVGGEDAPLHHGTRCCGHLFRCRPVPWDHGA